MNDFVKFAAYLGVMAGVTYLVRMIPLVLFKKKIKNKLIRSFLYYIPYAVLGVMTIPSIFYATDSFISAVAGFTVAIVLAYFEKGLLTVAACSCCAAFVAELIIKYAL